ncbi:hypothetical protein BDC45DRAFT_542090 [Circinella umbellata]|nr:hypothetical protein BDC45DRAFT_542090 [Circinella umbellata]
MLDMISTQAKKYYLPVVVNFTVHMKILRIFYCYYSIGNTRNNFISVKPYSDSIKLHFKVPMATKKSLGSVLTDFSVGSVRGSVGGGEEDDDEEYDEEDDEEEEQDDMMDVDWRFGDADDMDVDWWEGDMEVDILPPNATSLWF